MNLKRTLDCLVLASNDAIKMRGKANWEESIIRYGLQYGRSLKGVTKETLKMTLHLAVAEVLGCPSDLDKEEASLLAGVQRCDGLELHRDDWPTACSLSDKGLVRLSSPRGPGKNFMRVSPH